MEGITMKLPMPRTDSEFSVEQAVLTRRTVRSFSTEALSASQLSQILWAAQGVTEEGTMLRAVPSAGALYPTELYAALGEGTVEGLDKGIYRYLPESHDVEKTDDRDVRNDLARASLSQMWMARAPVSIVICSEYSRVSVKYGQRGLRYAMIEAGGVAENIFLQARALGLDTGVVGAFLDREVVNVLNVPVDHEPLLIVPVGYAG